MNDNSPLGRLIAQVATELQVEPEVAQQWRRQLTSQLFRNPQDLCDVTDAQFQSMQIPVAAVVKFRRLVNNGQNKRPRPLEPEPAAEASSGSDSPQPEGETSGSSESSGSSGSSESSPSKKKKKNAYSEAYHEPELLVLQPLPNSPNKLKLRPCVIEKNLRKNFETCRNDTIGSISFIGSTGAGKSFSIRELLAPFVDSFTPEVLQRGKDFSSTTHDVNLYISDIFKNQGVPMTFAVDCEGEDGGVPNGWMDPFKRILGAAWSKLPENKIELARRKAVSQYFPALAMALSDIVVFVTPEGLTNRALKDKIVNLGESCLSKTTETSRPTLIIISNKISDLRSEFDIEATTQGFIDAQDPQGMLKELFKKVIAVKLPSKYSQDKRIDGKTLIQTQISTLRQLIGRELQDRVTWRRDSGCVMNEQLWYHLFGEVVKKIVEKQPIHVYDIVARLITPKKEFVLSHVIQIFHVLYPPEAYSSEQFRVARRFAFLTLARLYVTFLDHKGTTFAEAAWWTQQAEDALRRLGRTLWNELDKYAPCEAVFRSSIVPTKGCSDSHRCGRSRFCHQQHKTIGPIAFEECYERVKDGILNFIFQRKAVVKRWGNKIRHEWAGDFDYEETEDADDLIDLVIQSVNDFRASKKSMAVTALSTFAESGIATPKFARVSNNSSACFFCFCLANSKHVYEAKCSAEPLDLLTVCFGCSAQVKKDFSVKVV